MVDHYPDGHNVGLGMVQITPEEREIERLDRKVAILTAGLRAMKKWLVREVCTEVEALELPAKEKNYSPDYLNDLAAMRRAVGKIR